MTVPRHSYRVVTSRTFIVFDVAKRLVEPDAACVEHRKSDSIKPKSTRAAFNFNDTPSPMLEAGSDPCSDPRSPTRQF